MTRAIPTTWSSTVRSGQPSTPAWATKSRLDKDPIEGITVHVGKVADRKGMLPAHLEFQVAIHEQGAPERGRIDVEFRSAQPRLDDDLPDARSAEPQLSIDVSEEQSRRERPRMSLR